MKKKLFVACCILLTSAIANAQDSISVKNDYTPTPLITIKGEEFKRFPSGNFLDAVNGLFPWVFSLTPDANNFLYVVNGFLMADVNGISLYDIEEVSFSASSLNGNLYPLSKAGTFYITTRKATDNKLTVSFNTQLNIAAAKGLSSVKPESWLLTTDISKGHSGYISGNHIALTTAGKKWNLYIGAQLDYAMLPLKDYTSLRTYTGTSSTDSLTQTIKPHDLNIRSLAQFSYQISPKLSVGITGNYFHGNSTDDVHVANYYRMTPQTGTSVSKEKNKLPYYYGSACIDWNPIENFSNKIYFEYATNRVNDHYENEAISVQSTNSGSGHYTTETALHNKRLLLRDEMKYTFHSTERFKVGVSTVFSYITQKEDYSSAFFYSSAQFPPSSGGYNYLSSQKLTSLNQSVFFSYNNLVSGYGGYAILLNKYLSKYNATSRQNPYAGFTLNLKNIIPTGDKVNRFDFSFDYGNLTRNDATYNWLPGVDIPIQQYNTPGGSQYFGSIVNVLFNPALGNKLLKNTSVSLLLNASFFNSRLSVGGGFSELRADNIYNVTANIPGDVGLILQNKNTAINQGIQLYATAKLIDQTLKSWSIRLNMLSMPKTRYRFNYDFMAKVPSLQDQLEVGLQNYLSCKNWFVQLNGLMALNKKTVNTFLLNYVLVGYDFAETKSKFLKNKSLFVQARNLVSSGASKNYYGYYRYVGLGANLLF